MGGPRTTRGRAPARTRSRRTAGTPRFAARPRRNADGDVSVLVGGAGGGRAKGGVSRAGASAVSVLVTYCGSERCTVGQS